MSKKEFSTTYTHGLKLDSGKYTIPEKNNLVGTIYSTQTKLEIAINLSALGWSVRKCTWVDYEVECEWAEFTLEGEKETLLNGVIAVQKLDELKEILDGLGYAFSIDLYNDHDELMRTIMSKA